MLKFNSVQLLFLISNSFWPFVRILSFFSTAPIFDNKSISKKIKILLSIVISWIIFPFLPNVNINLFSLTGIFVLFQQIFIGISFGFTSQLLFSAINFSGEIIGLQMGLSFATFFNPNNYNFGSSVVARLLNILAFILFLSVNMHLYLIFILINSFYSIPISENFFSMDIISNILKFSSSIFLNSILFAFPMIVFLLLSSLIMGFLNRFSPQMSIFSIGFPLNLLIGILTLYYLLPTIFPFFQNLLNQLIVFIFQTFFNTSLKS